MGEEVPFSGLAFDEQAKTISRLIDPESEKKATERAWLVGAELAVVRKAYPHGQWQLWVQINCPKISTRTARLYLWIHNGWKHRRGSKWHGPATLTDLIAAIRDGKQEERRKDREKWAERGRAVPVHQDFRFLCSPFQMADIRTNSADVVVVDPPWDKRSAGLYGEAAEKAAQILRPGGLFLAYLANLWIPTIIPDMCRHLQWQWILAAKYNKETAARTVQPVGVKPKFRPIALLSKGPPRKKPDGQYWVYDCVDVDVDEDGAGKSKAHHDWGQAVGPLVHWLTHLSRPGDTVVDLTLGGGATAVAVKRIGQRKFVGVDMDQANLDRVKLRLAEME